MRSASSRVLGPVWPTTPAPTTSIRTGSGCPTRPSGSPASPGVHAGAVAECTFCAIVAGAAPAAVVLDEPSVVGFLDVRPVFPGHVLLVPRLHRGTFAELPDDERDALFEAAQRVAAAVREGLGSGGAWVSLNDRVSQSVPHVHVHVIPRTKGDGLRGFYWPRTRYADDAEAEAVAARIRSALAGK